MYSRMQFWKISGAEFRLVQNVQENGNLRSKVAQSPDKVLRALEEKKLAREEARNAERLAMHTLHEKTSLVEVFSKNKHQHKGGRGKLATAYMTALLPRLASGKASLTPASLTPASLPWLLFCLVCC
ncbi:kinetochore protein Nuf2-like [Trifolium pratense]|uniref:Kinetochore protein Nuf2-like n=1 Tax=Trifolium pratense TaxID=57577 RepID=A0A2K3L8A8_TRIPR|nr:kinetochore protein Nuf2-like [Trifolium pratense]